MPRRSPWPHRRIYTIGHSTRALDELISALRAFGVSALVDIRTVPRSRHNPQFDADTLGRHLAEANLRYVPIAELGGLRKPRPGSVNTAWRNASFQGYADHMQTAAFEAGLDRLAEVDGVPALMCAEAVPWRCHRSLVADALTVRGADVEHIIGVRASPHRLTPFAQVDGIRVTYPAERGDRLAVRPPYHLEATVRLIQRRPSDRVDRWDGERYRRVLDVGGKLVLAEVTDAGTVDAPDLRLRVAAGEESAAAVVPAVRRLLGLDADVDLARLGHEVPAFASAVAALRGMRPPRFAGLFETVARVVPFQQVSLDAGVAVVGRIVQRFGRPLEHAGDTFHAFPDAETVADAPVAALRACGLSERKSAALREIARAIASGELTEQALDELPSDDAARALDALPGIGPWSANLILLRGLGRLDVFPPGDVGALRGLGDAMGVGSSRALEAAARRLGDERGLLYFLSLGAALLAAGLIHPADPR